MGSLGRGGDLLGELRDLCVRESVKLGRIEAIGSVQRARLGYYHQRSREYRYFALNEPLEISSLIGNISIKDGQPFVHAHVNLSDARGKTFGGHLASGTIVFACEYTIEAFGGMELTRVHDEGTGLHLWRGEDDR